MVKVHRFVQQHLAQIMEPYLRSKNNKIPPLDQHLSDYFRSHKSLGSSQRRDLYNNTYDLIRHHFLLTHLCKGSQDFDLRLSLLHSSDFYNEMENKNLSKYTCNHSGGFEFHFLNRNSPVYLRLYEKIQQSSNLEFEAFDRCKVLNTRAPLTVRINPDKTTRADFLKKISSFLKIELQKTQISPYGVIIPSNKNIDLYQTQQFKNGHFEIQDQASQLAAFQVKCRPGDIVLDFCSGSGGKSLAIAHLLKGKGQIFLHDPRIKTIENAKKRFQKANITNVQFHTNEESLEKIILNKVDWLILDVPCSGSGTIRRNPDIKLRFSQETLKHHIMQQEQIFVRSLKYLRKGGHIVYMTCSILQEENENQIRKFVKNYNMEVVDNQILRTKTEKGGMDSMFAAVLKKKN